MAGVWQAFGVAVASTCISIDGPSMHGNARCGHVLNVDEEYRASSHAFMRSLFSGVQGNGMAGRRGGATSRWGHEHGSCGVLGALQPLLSYRAALIDAGSDDASESAIWVLSLGVPALSMGGKSFARRPRLSNVS